MITVLGEDLEFYYYRKITVLGEENGEFLPNITVLGEGKQHLPFSIDSGNVIFAAESMREYI